MALLVARARSVVLVGEVRWAVVGDAAGFVVVVVVVGLAALVVDLVRVLVMVGARRVVVVGREGRTVRDRLLKDRVPPRKPRASVIGDRAGISNADRRTRTRRDLLFIVSLRLGRPA
jgi:hypothetical protein